MTRQRIHNRIASTLFVVLLLLVTSMAQTQPRPTQRSVVKSDAAGIVADTAPALSFLFPIVFDSGGSGSSSPVVADLNGDGKPDLLVTDNNCQNNSCDNSLVSVLLGNGNGTFQPAVTYSTGGLYASLTLADVNGDGKLDIVAANEFSLGGQNPSNIGVLLGNGDGTFQNVVTYNSGGFMARSVAVADLNGDGKLDIVVAHACVTATELGCDFQTVPGILGVLLGNGDGTFQTAVTYAPGGFLTSSVVIGDFNSDGKPDIAVANWCAQGCLFDGEGNVSLLFGNGDGTFQPAVSYDSGGTDTSSVMTADLNQDNRLDLIAINSGSAAVFLGNGDGTFKPAVTYAGATGPGTLADLNRDVNLDLLVRGGGLSNIGVFLGNGDGTFQPVTFYATGAQSLSFVTASDLNGDGWSDVIFGSGYTFNGGLGDGQVGVLLNNTGALLVPSTTLLTSSLNPSFAGQPVTFTVRASSSAGPLPNGETITFYYYGAPGIIGTTKLSAGNASVTTSSFPAGTTSVIAIYDGDGHFGPSMSPVVSQVVKPTTKSVTSATLTSSLNPSIYGQRVSWIATVTTAGSNPPTGKVNFVVGSVITATVPLNSSGVASLTKSKLNADPYSVTAVYLGDANNLGTKSPSLTQVVNQAASSAALKSSPNPSTSGQPVTLTATITSPTVEPTGPVTFSTGKTVLGTAQLGGGKAKFSTSTLAVGTTTITATYSGDSNIAGSSASLTHTVQP